MTVSETSATSLREEALAELRTTLRELLVAVRRLRGRQARRPGELSFAHYHLLFALAEHGDLSTTELAAKAEITPATATQMLDALDELGLVERARSSSDRRIVTCSLTKRGHERVEVLREELDGYWREATAAFDAAELETATAVLGRLRHVFERLDRERRA
jgi:DNA-binding MarR family transcriptional regulator